MSRLGNILEDNLIPSLYTFEGMDAVRHIFMVASSLDSMIVGEPQILGQIKDAYAEAARQKTSGVILNRIMHRAFHVAKRVRTETGVCETAVSISYAAVELAKKIFHVLDGKKILLIGAGEMAELAARHLLSNGVTSMVVANRTFERAVQVAELFAASPVSFEEITSQLKDVDIVVTATASQEFVITYEQVKSCLRKRRNRPLFFIDIAVPRDVQPDVNDLDNVYVYDIDDLKGIIQVNMEQRELEAVKAERIVLEEVIQFEKWLKTLAVVPTIVSLREKAESIVQAELKKSRSALGELTPGQMERIEILTRSVAEKVLSDPISFLKRKAGRPTLNSYLDMAKKLFCLDRE
jgi:glutamyl-tRNA reductase